MDIVKRRSRAGDTTASYSVPTDRKLRKLRTEQSSLESIHHLRVSTRRVFISVKTIVLARRSTKCSGVKAAFRF